MTTKPGRSITAQTLSIYLESAKRFKSDALIALLNPIGAAIINVGLPLFAGKAIAAVATNNGQFNQAIMSLIVVAIMGIAFNRVAFRHLMVLQAKSMADLGMLVFNRLLDRSIRYHSENISGKLVSDAIDFVVSYANLILMFFINGLNFLLTVVIGLLIILFQSWQLGLLVFFIASVTFIWAFYDAKLRRNLRTERLKASKKVTGHLADTIVNVQTVKIFSGEKLESQKHFELNDVLKKVRMHDWQLTGKSGNNRMAALMVSVILLLVFMKNIAGSDPSTLGASIFAFAYVFTLILRLFDVNNMTRLIEEALLNAQPITKMLQEPVEVIDSPTATDLSVTTGSITFDQVSFMYQETAGSQEVFKNFSLSIRPGEKIGLVGPSGGGKSTFTKLLMRFDDVQDGAIIIDNSRIDEVTQSSLRQNIAYVPQEPLLFHRSIIENIGYGKPSASQKDIEHAAKLAHAHEFITSLPGGYDTVVGERGVKLSGGQRQRVAIARAIIKDAPILILDEATSALDSESEALIQDSLKELMKNKTSVVIAHRLSTIQRMDRIIVLDEGKIVEEGSHTQLLAKNGLYARLWKHQSGGFLQD